MEFILFTLVMVGLIAIFTCVSKAEDKVVFWAMGRYIEASEMVREKDK